MPAIIVTEPGVGYRCELEAEGWDDGRRTTDDRRRAIGD